MKRQFLWLFCVLLTLAAPSRVPADTPIVPSKWQPDLSTAIEDSTADLQDASAQMRMNALSRQIADMKDAQLFVLYIRLFEQLDPKNQKQLMTEQTNWLKDRARAAREAIQSEGGSLAPLESNMAESEFTENRIGELTKRLKQIETGKQKAG